MKYILYLCIVEEDETYLNQNSVKIFIKLNTAYSFITRMKTGSILGARLFSFGSSVLYWLACYSQGYSYVTNKQTGSSKQYTSFFDVICGYNHIKLRYYVRMSSVNCKKGVALTQKTGKGCSVNVSFDQRRNMFARLQLKLFLFP